jgi:hypothetical protein
MKTMELIEKISAKDFDVDEFVQLVIVNQDARIEIVHQMLTNPAIMVYYHCYYIVEKASLQQPMIFYPFWDKIAALLHHKNSYHRDFGLEIIGNLCKVDKENRFDGIEDEFFALINDEKFMTGNVCVKSLLKIFQHKPDKRARILETLLDIENQCDYTEKQIGVLKADVLEIFGAIYDEIQDHDAIRNFVKAEANSISPKTRKTAKKLVKELNL